MREFDSMRMLLRYGFVLLLTLTVLPLRALDGATAEKSDSGIELSESRRLESRQRGDHSVGRREIRRSSSGDPT